MATSVSSVSTLPGSGSLFFFSDCSAAPHHFIACSLTFLSSASSSSSLPPVLRAPPVSSAPLLSFSFCLAFPGGFWCCSGVRCGPCFSYCLFSFLGYFSFPSSRWGSNSFRGFFCSYSPFDLAFHLFCSGVLSGYFFVIFCCSSSSFGSFLLCSRWVLGVAAPATLLHDAYSAAPDAVPGSVRFESRRMLAFLRVCFPQAAGVRSGPLSSPVF